MKFQIEKTTQTKIVEKYKAHITPIIFGNNLTLNSISCTGDTKIEAAKLLEETLNDLLIKLYTRLIRDGESIVTCPHCEGKGYDCGHCVGGFDGCETCSSECLTCKGNKYIITKEGNK